MYLEFMIEFNVLAECLNFSAAAKELYVSQPTLSKHMAALEEDLGFRLIERQPATRLTPAGVEFHKRTAGLLDETVRVIEDVVMSAKNLNETTVEMLVPDYLTLIDDYYSFVSKAKLVFEEANSPLVIRPTYVRSEDWQSLSLAKCLCGGGVDFVFSLQTPDDDEGDVVERFRHEGLDAVRAGRERFELVMDARHPLNSKDEIGVCDLDGCEFQNQGRGFVELSMADAIVRLFAGSGVSVAPKKPFYSTDAVNAWDSIDLGASVLFAPKPFLQSSGFAAQSRYVVRELEGFEVELDYYCVFRRDPDRAPMFDALASAARDAG